MADMTITISLGDLLTGEVGAAAAAPAPDPAMGSTDRMSTLGSAGSAPAPDPSIGGDDASSGATVSGDGPAPVGLEELGSGD